MATWSDNIDAVARAICAKGPAHGRHRECGVRRHRFDHSGLPRRACDLTRESRAGVGWGLDRAVARDRMHWLEHRDVAGLSLSMCVENLGACAYFRRVATPCGRHGRRLQAWPRKNVNSPAARNEHHLLQSNGQQAEATMRPASTTPGTWRTVSAFRTACCTATA